MGKLGGEGRGGEGWGGEGWGREGRGGKGRGTEGVFPYKLYGMVLAHFFSFYVILGWRSGGGVGGMVHKSMWVGGQS